MVRVMIVEAHGVLRGALRAMLAIEPDLEVVAEAALVDDAVAIASVHRPDVLVADVDVLDDPNLTGAERLASAAPDARILVLARRVTPAVVRRALDLGIRGVISSESAPEVLIGAVRRLAAGEWVVDPVAVMEALQKAENPLTERERQVLRIAADGTPVQDIAARLYLSEGTVRNHISSAIRKVGGGNRLSAVRRAREAGWI